MTVATFPLGDARIERAPVGLWAGPYTYRCRSCGITWDAAPGRRTGEWWACPNNCNWDVVDRYREWTSAEARREMDEHAARVRVHQEAVAQEIDAIIDSDRTRTASLSGCRTSGPARRRRTSRWFEGLTRDRR